MARRQEGEPLLANGVVWGVWNRRPPRCSFSSFTAVMKSYVSVVDGGIPARVPATPTRHEYPAPAGIKHSALSRCTR